MDNTLKMHRFLRITLVILSAFMLIGFIFLSIGYRLVTRSLPDTSGAMPCAGLRTAVQVYRDDFGIPYVMADNKTDLFFTQGFLTAQDRFFQMDLNRHLISGRVRDLLLITGSKTDSLMQSAGLWAQAEQDYRNLPAEIRQIFQNYSDGVNAYLEMYQDKLPIEYALLVKEPDAWQPEHSLALLYLRAWQRQSNGLLRVLSQWVDTDTDSFHTTGHLLREGFIHPPPIATMSWIISGKKTKSGKPILAAAFNEPPVLPNVWYEIHLFCPEFKAGGFSLPGVPMVLCGQNGQVAWASSIRQTWEPSHAWHASGTCDYIQALHAVIGSASVTDQPISMSDWILFSADTSGNIAVYPNRLWTETPDWIATDGTRMLTDRDSMPLDAWQLRRLSDLLNADSSFTPYEIRQLQSDTRSAFALDIMEQMLPVLDGVRYNHPVATRAIDQLASWDGEMRSGSSEALIFQTWLSLMFEQENSAFLFGQLHPVAYQNFAESMKHENKTDLPRQRFLDTIRLLRQQYGDDMTLWSWGAARQVRFRHPLKGNPLLDMVMTLGPFHYGGSALTILGAAHAIGSPERITWIQSARIVMTLDDLNRTFSALSTGQSGQPVDAHYRDQIANFLSKKGHPNLTDINRIHRSGWELLTLNPGDEHGKNK